MAVACALSSRRRVRFDRAAEFLAACASGDTDEAKEMLREAREIDGQNGELQEEVVNCANADGITALHQVRTTRCLNCVPVCVMNVRAA